MAMVLFNIGTIQFCMCTYIILTSKNRLPKNLKYSVNLKLGLG